MDKRRLLPLKQEGSQTRLRTSAIAFEVNGSKFLVGTFVNTVVSFLLIGTTVYFLIVAPMNALTERMRKGEAPADPTTRQCPECLSEIPIAARRCKFCATALTR